MAFKKMMSLQMGLILVWLLVWEVPGSRAWIDWRTLKTSHFTVAYKPGYKEEADRFLKVLETYRGAVVDLIGNDPGSLPVILEDWGQVANGFADPFFKRIILMPYPPDFQSLGGVESWYRLVGVHEYTHIAHFTYTEGVPKVLTRLFGRAFQPNLYSPGWIGEGVTAFSESQASSYEGRLNDGFFDAYMGTRVSGGKFPSLLNVTYEPFGFPFGRIYLYGGKFFDYLAHEYGRERFRRFFGYYASSSWSFLSPLFPSLGLDRAARKAFGKPFPELFQEWQEYEEEKGSGWRMSSRRETQKGWYIFSPVLSGQKLYYVRQHYRKTGALSIFGFVDLIVRDLEARREKVLVSLTTGVGALQVQGDYLYYTAYELIRGYANVTQEGFGVLSLLHRLDLRTGEDRVLLRDRIRAFCPLEDGRILYSRDWEEGFGSEIWLYSPDRGRRELLLVSDYLVGEMVTSLDYIIFAARRDWENPDLYLFDLSSKTLKPLVQSPYAEGAISLSSDLLLFRANYGGVYAAYAYDLKADKVYRLTTGGYANFPLLGPDGRLYFVGLHSEGFDLYYKEPGLGVEYRVPQGQKVQKSEVGLETCQGGYLDVLRPLLTPALHIPVAFADTLGWRLGGMFVGQDMVGEHLYTLYFDSHTVTGEVSPYLMFTSRFFSPLSLGVEYQGDSLGMGCRYPLLQRLHAGLSGVYISTSTSLFDRWSRREVGVAVSTLFHFPGLLGTLKVGYSGERDWWGSNFDRNAYRVQVGVRKAAGPGEFRVQAKVVQDLHNPEPLSPRARGYATSLSTKRFFLLNLEYSSVIFQLRRGFWNPNLFLEDIALVGFSDALTTREGKRQISAGLELRFEVSGGFIPQLCAPKVGVGITEQGQVRLYGGVEMGRLFRSPLGLAKGNRCSELS